MRSSRQEVCADLNPKSLGASRLWVMTKRTKTKVHWSGRSITSTRLPMLSNDQTVKQEVNWAASRCIVLPLIILGSRVTFLFHVTRPALQSASSYELRLSLRCVSSLPVEFSPTFCCGSLFSTFSRILAVSCKLLTRGTSTGATRSKFLDCSRRRQRVRTVRFVRIILIRMSISWQEFRGGIGWNSFATFLQPDDFYWRKTDGDFLFERGCINFSVFIIHCAVRCSFAWDSLRLFSQWVMHFRVRIFDY